MLSQDDQNSYGPPPGVDTSPAADGGARSRYPRRHFATDAGFMGALCLAASLAVPFFYQNRNATAWLGGVAIFVGTPLILGLLLGGRSRFARQTAVLLLLACPIVYAITDPLPHVYEIVRDSIFLTTGGMVILVCSGWTVTCLKSNRLTCAFASALGVLSGQLPLRS